MLDLNLIFLTFKKKKPGGTLMRPTGLFLTELSHLWLNDMELEQVD